MRGFTVHVYERDASPEARTQGGTLDLHADSGQIAIEALGLQSEFARLSRPEGQATRILDQHANVLLDEVPAPDDLFRPEIDRGDLRNLLLHSLRPGTVQWNTRVVTTTELGTRRVLVFEDGIETTVDLLIGCDGAWSHLRSLLTPGKPIYSGITYVETGIPLADTNAPEIAEIVGNGSMFALADEKAIMAQRNGGGYIRLYLAFAVEENWAQECGINFRLASRARAALLELFHGWHPQLRRILEVSEDRFLPRPLFRLPYPQQWPTQSTLTLLGDAAHLMTPFAGQGANLAMLDAVDLANHLTSPGFPTTLDALRAFESTMLQRSNAAAAETQTNQDICFGPNPAQSLAEVMQAHTS